MARPFYDKLEWSVIIAVGCIAVISVATIRSLSSSAPEAEELMVKQVGWFALGAFIVAMVISVDYHILSAMAYPLYLLVLAGLAAVLIPGIGQTIMGATRWIKIGPLTMQPSELTKTALILILSKYFSDKKKDTVFLSDLIVSSMLLGIPVVLILKEPDLGMSVVQLPIFAAIVFVAGIDRKYIIGLVTLALLSVYPAWLHLKDYQRERLISFMNPDSDPLGSGYHVIQSKIAIGSGGFWGKGYGNGKMSLLNFLPEQFTDFIFSVYSEQFGFVGCAVLLLIYLTLILKGLSIASKAKDKLGRLIAVGVVTVFTVQVFVNIGVTTGILPVTGLTLPFMSYGGSSIFSTSIMLGLLLNVSFRRYDF